MFTRSRVRPRSAPAAAAAVSNSALCFLSADSASSGSPRSRLALMRSASTLSRLMISDVMRPVEGVNEVGQWRKKLNVSDESSNVWRILRIVRLLPTITS